MKAILIKASDIGIAVKMKKDGLIEINSLEDLLQISTDYKQDLILEFLSVDSKGMAVSWKEHFPDADLVITIYDDYVE